MRGGKREGAGRPSLPKAESKALPNQTIRCSLYEKQLLVQYLKKTRELVAMPDKSKAVLAFINESFEPTLVTIEASKVPFAQIVKDHNGGQMIVYYDFLTDRVKWKFPVENHN